MCTLTQRRVQKAEKKEQRIDHMEKDVKLVYLNQNIFRNMKKSRLNPN